MKVNLSGAIAVEKRISQVLIVDDDPYISELIRSTLETEEYIIDIANDGLMALEKLNTFNPNLIILDIKMPGLDGIQVLQKIRETSEVPVIMLTGLTDQDALIQSMGLGADDFMRKPFMPRELAARVRAKLRRGY